MSLRGGMLKICFGVDPGLAGGFTYLSAGLGMYLCPKKGGD